MKLSPLLRRLLLVAFLLNGIWGAFVVLTSFAPGQIQRKDFVSGYLLAKALLAGVDPYLPLAELAGRLDFVSPVPVFPHPTPHTVPYGLLIAPLAGLSYERAAAAWFVVELLCLVAAVTLLVRWWHASPAGRWTALGGLALLGWGPLVEDLWVGQINVLLLLLLLLAWSALRRGRDLAGGALLGAALVLKLMAWPILLFLLFKRRWRSLLGAGAVAAAGFLATSGWIGIDGVKRYFSDVGPATAALYRGYDANFSLTTVGWRLFEGTGSAIARGIVAPPLLRSPTAAQFLSLAIPALVLGWALILAARSRKPDTAFALLLCAGLLVNPVAWSHYLVMALLPLAIVWRELHELGFPPDLTVPAVAVSLLCSAPHWVFRGAAELFARSTAADGSSVVPFAAGLLTLASAVALLLLILLLPRVEARALERELGNRAPRPEPEGSLLPVSP